MPEIEFVNLLGVLVIAFTAPLALGFAPRIRVPAVVLEIGLGILVGPDVLGWLEPDLAVQTLAILGLATLLFLAGLEIDLSQLRGRVLSMALVGYAISAVLGLGAGLALDQVGWVGDPLLFAVALSATSLGLVVPVLKDGGAAEGPLGQAVITSASVADFAAVLLLTLAFSDSGDTSSQVVLVVTFAGMVVIGGAGLVLSSRSMRLGDVFVRLQDTTAEIRVRGAVLLLIAFVVLAEELGLESILGAFLAGALVGLVDRGSTTHPHFRTKLEAVGYGFLVPVFFISSGLRLDVAGLVSSGDALARVPVFLLALLVARGVPALLYLRELGPTATAAAALLQATSLPFIVTATQIGVLADRLEPTTAAALVCAGLLSVLLFPVLATGLAGRTESAHTGGLPTATEG